ncbi:mannonate dehydratase [Acidicapsa dinghuensis]|uniref:Mannonate dehydratase n=1 Tax=Acidicapsa dinghuensis TaxID=2218256 RepID=A0ABW1EEM0_9BACT|nr:mannonate dehydratase [Acidicapsa dinghuensis]
MEQTWRWFGPHDNVTLSDARQAGASGIVSALHDIPPGEVWPAEAIREHQQIIAAAGMTWSVVESVNVSEQIKQRGPLWRQHIDNYIDTLRNLASCGIHIVCYNFMPVVDWVRTDLEYPLPDGSISLRYESSALAAFDLFILKRPGADYDWTPDQQRQASIRLSHMNETERDRLTRTLLAGLPGTTEVYSLDYVRNAIAAYHDIGRNGLRANLGEFLRAVCPSAQELGVCLCIHPDDPPWPVFGLPRIAGTLDDLLFLLDQAHEQSNGITFCSGSLGARSDNDLPQIFRRIAHRIRFVHLRSTKQQPGEHAFYEAPHLAGDVDIVALMKELVLEERRRHAAGDYRPIPFRADHGNKILTDIGRLSVPGYPAVGRLKALAELRGVMTAVEALA